MSTPNLEVATKRLDRGQRGAIAACVQHCDANEFVDDLAFIAQLLVDLMDVHAQGPVGYALVNAHRALIKTAQNEGIIEREPRVKHERIGPTPQEEIARFRDNAKALDDELVRIRERYRRDVERLQSLVEMFVKVFNDQQDQIVKVFNDQQDQIVKLVSERVAEIELRCHPGEKCSRWPECENCGPPRL